ncbi:NAD-dependent epimerase/dehydratase [Methanohalobium evestigatum Z-7303]|uniref:NAD-dependent epimerase/dehydratase n=1 Tax=Methanohalobium evestigatum (strain ATCC BAA-1072 / DSM 3721 / NBRC 107634 / OCM 161 / Z-7303) TaxID=644295 RepID=D7E7P8_METEZ|nr:NAD-dependent epimerase/dehydratase family protein [Methanohalobium evestigatum]ADI74121.1 NAD-dependent epimerase/dehydratase [Methanohalobium evestigatum Z-7303]
MFQTNLNIPSKTKILITGGAGFIGSHILDLLMEYDNEILIFDNLSSGNENFIKHHINKNNFKFIDGNLLNFKEIDSACEETDFVFHIAANPDVKLGSENTKVHFDQNIKATYNLLESMRKNNVKKIAFTSTSTIYGEADIIPTPENYGPLVPISLYGASKLSCEGLISSFCHTFDMQSWIFRFANIVGNRSNHGVIFDFIKKLKINPNQLEILGDGQQRKSYLHVHDCVNAILYSINKSNNTVNIYNIGSEDTINVTEIAEIVVDEMGLKNVEFNYTGGSRGWKGDVPKMMLSIDKLKNLGWEPTYNSEKSIRDTVKALI